MKLKNILASDLLVYMHVKSRVEQFVEKYFKDLNTETIEYFVDELRKYEKGIEFLKYFVSKILCKQVFSEIVVHNLISQIDIENINILDSDAELLTNIMEWYYEKPLDSFSEIPLKYSTELTKKYLNTIKDELLWTTHGMDFEKKSTDEIIKHLIIESTILPNLLKMDKSFLRSFISDLEKQNSKLSVENKVKSEVFDKLKHEQDTSPLTLAKKLIKVIEDTNELKPSNKTISDFSGIDIQIWNYQLKNATFLDELTKQLDSKIKQAKKPEKKDFWINVVCEWLKLIEKNKNTAYNNRKVSLSESMRRK